MSDENESGSEETGGIANLRKQYDELKKQNDALLTEVSTFRADQRASTVASVLKAKGLPEKAAKFYTDDDTSEDAVGKWIEENADVFGVQVQEQDQNSSNAERLSAEAFGNSSNTQNAPAKVLGNPAEIQHAIQNLPYDELVKLGYMPKDGTLFNNTRR